jgi:transcriptional regulator with AAA-type ATPase domain
MPSTLSSPRNGALARCRRQAAQLFLICEGERPSARGARHLLEGLEEVVIGRSVHRDSTRTPGRLQVRVPDPCMSVTHAYIRRQGGGFVLVDAASKNGSFVNQHRVTSVELSDGDIIECGRTFFCFRSAAAWFDGDPPDLDGGEAAMPGLDTLLGELAHRLRVIGEFARASVPILLLGESGTGKEVVAQATHRLAQRRGQFVAVNCGAIAENLLEAELFGARKGAFTGAADDRVGLVRASDNGTLFLDEVGDLPLRAQPALLRVLQEHEVMPVGATRAVPVNLQIVAATHRNLKAMVRAGQFRADLLARLSGHVVELPPLRRRREDLGLLLADLVARYAAAGARPIIGSEALWHMLSYRWPLNIRELEHCVRSALVLSPAHIDAEHLPPALHEPPALATDSSLLGRGAREATRPPHAVDDEARRQQLIALLVEHHGNISEVARQMGKARLQIRRWIKKYEIVIEEILA